MKNILVTGASTPLARALLVWLRRVDGVEHLVGVEPHATSNWIDGVELVALPADHQDLVQLLCQFPIDTVIHCDLAPDRNGSRETPHEARVVETMRIGAALAHGDTSVRSWVLASSSDVYPVSSHAPLLHRESGDLDASETGLAASLREAEDYARDVATRRPHLNVAVMRLQQLVGEAVRSPMTALLRQPVLPRLAGFDPPIQMLAIRDAVRALSFAARLELAGVYNVASVGTTRMSEAIRTLGRLSVPLLPLETPPVLRGWVRRLRAPHVPDGMLPTLRYGHALDTGKLAAAGFDPEYDQAACLELFRKPGDDDASA